MASELPGHVGQPQLSGLTAPLAEKSLEPSLSPDSSPLEDSPEGSDGPHLHAFMLETSVVLNYPARPARRPDSSTLSSVRAAWNDFLGLGTQAATVSAPVEPAAPRLATAVLPLAALADQSVGVLYAYPSAEHAPSRLSAFILPSSVTLLDEAGELPPPKLVQFCTTGSDGTMTWGCALQQMEAAGLPEDLPDEVPSITTQETSYGDSMQLQDLACSATDAQVGASASSAAACCNLPARRQRMAVRSLAVLSKWPMVELQKTILKHIAANRVSLWPAPPASEMDIEETTRKAGEYGHATSASDADVVQPSIAGARLRAQRLTHLFRQIEREMLSSHAELSWLLAHPLWLPVPLAPLCRALRWEASQVAYLLMAVLTDQKVLLHSREPLLAFHAASALRYLMAPLEYSGVFIPLLPPPLMPPNDAATLLFDCSTPYLIGCETLLLRRLGGASTEPQPSAAPAAKPPSNSGSACARAGPPVRDVGASSTPRGAPAHQEYGVPLSQSCAGSASAVQGASSAASVSARAAAVPDLVVVDLDRGVVHQAPATRRWLSPRAPPLSSLCTELGVCMGDTVRFRQSGVQVRAKSRALIIDLRVGTICEPPSPY